MTAIVFADGEIFSNLQLTQSIYDALPEQERKIPLSRSAVLAAVETVVPALLHEDNVVFQSLMGAPLQSVLTEIQQLMSDENSVKSVLTQANAETLRYAEQFGVDSSKAKTGKK